MEDPAPDEDFLHICPACKRPVTTGFKFCEVCGAKIPSLLTCSKCGTQFVHPKKYCDCCGARFVPKEIAGPTAGESPEPEAGDVMKPDDEKSLESPDKDCQVPDAEESPEPEEGEPESPGEEAAPGHSRDAIPEPDFEGPPKSAGDEDPERKGDGIRIPDTQELLETYGKEYDDDETLGSSHRAKKPAPARKERRSRETVPDALVPVDGERAPAKYTAGRMRVIGGGFALIVILAAFYFIGLPLFSGSGEAGAGDSPAPVITPDPDPGGTTQPAPVVTATTASGAFTTRPTETVPDQQYYFVVRKDPLTLKISVIFVGSASSNTINSAEVRVTRPDGVVGTGIILPLKGISEIFLDGSDGADRVEIMAKTATGETYRVYDALVSPLT